MNNQDVLLEKAKAIHKSSVVADTHSDIPTDLYRRHQNGDMTALDRLHLPRLLEGGVSVCAMAVNNDSFVGGLQADSALRRVICMLDVVETQLANSSAFKSATTSSEIRSALDEAKIAVPLGLEGGACIGESLETIRILYRLGIRSVTLTWNYRNGIGDGTAEESRGGGLSRFGELAVKEMQRLGILVDVSHMTSHGVKQVVSISERPIVASHSNARAIHDHPRNLADDVAEAIVSTGGLVGICFYPGFVDDTTPTLSKVIDHIDYMVGLVGIDHVALGPDFIDYMSDFMNDKLSAANIGYLDDPVYPEGITGVHQFHNITAALIARNYSNTDITKILGENYLRVFERAVG